LPPAAATAAAQAAGLDLAMLNNASPEFWQEIRFSHY
jgi:hypothetical protein